MTESKEWKKAYNKAYYEANKEREKKRKLEYYHQNKDKIDREKKAAYHKQWREQNQEHLRIRREAYNDRRNYLRRLRYATNEVHREKVKRQARQSNKRNRTAKKNGRLRLEFGITLEDYNRILEKQGGGCAICGATRTGVKEPGKAEHSLYVDHNHETGEVRGILCSRCNFGLGQFQDNPELLMKAVDYLLTNGSSGAT